MKLIKKGPHLAAKDLIITVKYRVSSFLFLSNPDQARPANKLHPWRATFLAADLGLEQA